MILSESFIFLLIFYINVTNTTELSLDRIFLELVPKAVDHISEAPNFFRDANNFWDYSVQQVKEFLSGLPDKYKEKSNELFFKDKQCAIFKFPNEAYDLVIGFKPGYRIILASEVCSKISKDAKKIIIEPDDVITLPTFDLHFRPVDDKGTGVILENALNKFYLKQGDIENGTLMAFGVRGKEVVQSDLELLDRFLPEKMFSKRTIHARCNYALGNGEAVYKI